MENKRIATIALGILAVALCFTLVGVLITSQRSESQVAAKDYEPTTEKEESPEKWQEGVITYKGKKYKYNSNLKNYLFMGIDKDEPVQATDNYMEGGQSDAMFVIVADPVNEELSLITINRNSITAIETCDEEGNSTGTIYAQICIQHGFGDGKKLSCVRAQRAVSNLLYNLPIEGYISMNMGGIPSMNDAIGGVTLEVLHGLQDVEEETGLVEGETVTLNGEQAYTYIRKRDLSEFDSATYRLRRQEQYISAYFEKMKASGNKNAAQVLALYDSISEYLVTSVDFSGILTELTEYEYDDSRLYTVPGETKMGETFEEFYVDEDALYDMIIQIFYEEITEE